MTTSTDWDSTQHPRGEGMRFVEKQQSPSAAAFPGASGFIRHSDAEGTYAFPPKRFYDVDEAVAYWSQVEVSEKTLFGVQHDQRKFRERRGGAALEALRERYRHKAMVEAVQAFPEPERKDIAIGDERLSTANSTGHEWFGSRSKKVLKAREEFVEKATARAARDIEAEWSENTPGLPPEVSAFDARTVARVVRMTELFGGDKQALRDVQVEFRGDVTTVGVMEEHLGGFTHFYSCRGARTDTEQAAEEGHTLVDW